jgi:hypothetical protein
VLLQIVPKVPRVELQAQRGGAHVGGLKRRKVLVDGWLVLEEGGPTGGDAVRDGGQLQREDVEEALCVFVCCVCVWGVFLVLVGWLIGWIWV